MELIAKANRQLRKSVTRASSSEEYRSADIAKLSFDSSSINADLFCVLHNGPLRDPRRLPCSHSFCYQCLVEIQRNNATSHRIVCAVCQTSHDIDSVDELYVDYSLVRQLTNAVAEDNDEEGDENEKLALEVSRTLRMLKEAENVCDGAMVQIRQMNADVASMRSSIAEKRKALETKFAAARALEDDTTDQHRVLTCLGYDCHFMQETIRTAQRGAFSSIREANVSVHHTSTLVKGAGLFNIWLKDEQPMSDSQLKRATRLVSQIWLTQENPYQMATDEESARRARGEFAKRLASSFRSQFSQSSSSSSTSSTSSSDDDGGVWTAIVGARKLLDFYVYSHREFYICMEIQKMRIVIYRCVEDPDCPPVDPGRAALFETFVRQRLDDALKKRKKDPHNAVRPAQHLSEHLKMGLNGGLWHCVGGLAKTYAIHTTGERTSQTVVNVDGNEYGVWQCNCASFRNFNRRNAQRSFASLQKGQAGRYSEEVEYDEPYCLD